MYVDGQFYGLELLPLHTAQQLDVARKLFMCSTFQLPKSTARNLVYVLFPVMPSLFLLLKRRWSFYSRAQSHDVAAVRDAFSFDATRLYPHSGSWAFQTMQMLRELGLYVTVNDHVRLLERVCLNLNDVDQICFDHVSTTSEKTLSFFRLFRDVDTARSFRAFLSSQAEYTQNFMLLFFTSGLRWRFFSRSGRGCHCSACAAHFWSWEHFLSCPVVIGATLVPRLRVFVTSAAWDDIYQLAKDVTVDWRQAFADDSVSDYVQGL